MIVVVNKPLCTCGKYKSVKSSYYQELRERRYVSYFCKRCGDEGAKETVQYNCFKDWQFRYITDDDLVDESKDVVRYYDDILKEFRDENNIEAPDILEGGNKLIRPANMPDEVWLAKNYIRNCIENPHVRHNTAFLAQMRDEVHRWEDKVDNEFRNLVRPFKAYGDDVLIKCGREMLGEFSSESQFPEHLNANPLLEELWRRGVLDHRLTPNQLKFRGWIRSIPKGEIGYANCTRRFGKTLTFLGEGFCKCLNNNNYFYAHIMPEKSGIRKILDQMMPRLLLSMPKDLMPNYNKDLSAFCFKNGSRLSIYGVEKKQYEMAAGVSLNFITIDEVSLITELDRVLTIFLPMVHGSGGSLMMVGTIAKSNAMPCVKYKKEAMASGHYISFALKDADILTDSAKKKIIESKAYSEEQMKTEYFMEEVRDPKSLILPEFDNKVHVGVCKRPTFFNSYIAYDAGEKESLHAAIGGYYDFEKGVFVIEHEYLEKMPHLGEISDGISKIKKEYDDDSLTMIADMTWNMRNELQRVYNLQFGEASKEDKQASRAQVRSYLRQNKIIISPNCENLIKQMQEGLLDEREHGLIRFKFIKGFGHFDLVDALFYFIRAIDTESNPIPEDLDFIETMRIRIKNGRRQKQGLPPLSYKKKGGDIKKWAEIHSEATNYIK